MSDYKKYLVEKIQLPEQKILIQPVWRQATNEEYDYIFKNWSFVFKAKNSPILSGFFTVLFAFVGVALSILAIVSLFINFAAALFFGVFAAGLIALAITSYKSQKQGKLEYENFTNKQLVVIDAKAVNLQLYWSYQRVDAGEVYAFVNILTPSGKLAVQNIEIPNYIGKELRSQNIQEFPCLLVKVKDKKELLAIPKI